MGVKLKNIAPKHETSFKELKGKKIGIDAFNWLYQFLSIIRQPDGTPLKNSKGQITSHLTGLFYRTSKLLEEGIKPCYIFDGKPPAFKKVITSRIERKEKALKEYKEAIKKGDLKTALSKASQTSRLTKEMMNEAKELLNALGVPVIQAPSEGEAQASIMTKQEKIYATATQDYDALLFGSPTIIRNLNITGKRKIGNTYITIKPEMIKLKELLKQNKINQEELIMLGILIGTDYNPGGVKGIGPKKGLKLVQEHGVEAWKQVKYEWTINPIELIEFFKKPPITNNYQLEWRPVNKQKVINLLVNKFEFNKERINNTLNKIIKITSQTGLDNFI